MSYKPGQYYRHCEDCTNFNQDLYGNLGWCMAKHMKVYSKSVACDDYDDTTIF